LIVLSSAFYARAVFAVDEAFFILSNNHVLARENRATYGDAIPQPGCETGAGAKCAPNCVPADKVAFLSAWQNLVPGGADNEMDAAIAQILPRAVDTTGEILDLGAGYAGDGPPGITPKAAAVEGLVKKSGRTTGFTRGKIKQINGTADIEYVPGVVHFVKVIFIEDDAGKTPFPFGDGGDSGSLIVEDTSAACPAPQGLLFGGLLEDCVLSQCEISGNACTTARDCQPKIIYANPIQLVLDRFNVDMVGCVAGGGGGGAGSGPPVAPSFAAGPFSAVDLQYAMGVQEAREAELFAVPGVVAVAIGASKTAPDQPAIVVYVEGLTPEIRRLIPSTLDGVEVRVERSGPSVPLGGWVPPDGSPAASERSG
jgi:hypothetical protein